MAAIVGVADPARAQFLRNVTAQATTGQTDWVNVPAWAKYAYYDYNLTATAQHFPKVDLTIKVPDLATRDDTTSVVNFMNHAALTQLTGVARILGQLGPNVTGIADDLTNAATGLSNISINGPLPPLLGFKVLNDRTAQSEVQTVTLTSADAGDTFKLTQSGVETIAFVIGTNATAAAIQTDVRSKWSDTLVAVTGTTDTGPFTFTFSDTTDQAPITVTSTIGMSGSVAETWKGGLISTYTYSLTVVFS